MVYVVSMKPKIPIPQIYRIINAIKITPYEFSFTYIAKSLTAVIANTITKIITHVHEYENWLQSGAKSLADLSLPLNTSIKNNNIGNRFCAIS